ncbi:helix-turn-helix domain-containing protein [Williamsia sp. MIQD14]|uniref:helix-turn-helix domain-containing protein n=1 Tax=Williamsia sp. MIQD14 TaxID=3425703 RepID=UPI003DA00F6D
MDPTSFSAAVGERVRELRGRAGLSLSELARRSGVGKSSLSDLEAGRRNPTIETLYALCTPLGVPMTALTAASIRTESGGMTSVTLDIRELVDATVEVFRLEFAADADHTSPGHVTGVTEHLTVVAGDLLVGPLDNTTRLGAGESHSWRSDTPHRYTTSGPAEAVVVIRTPRRAGRS